MDCRSRLVGLRPNPLQDRFLVPLWPGAITHPAEHIADLQVLVVNRPLGIDLDEFEDHGERFIFTNDLADELLVTLIGILDIRDVLTRFVILRGACSGDASAAGFRRY